MRFFVSGCRPGIFRGPARAHGDEDAPGSRFPAAPWDTPLMGAVLTRRRFFTYLQDSPHIHPTVEINCGECCLLKGNIEERACQLALYIIENKATVRAAAQKFGTSKSTVHKDLSERLPAFNKPLYEQVKGVLDENKAERHIRGGIATRKKYKGD